MKVSRVKSFRSPVAVAMLGLAVLSACTAGDFGKVVERAAKGAAHSACRDAGNCDVPCDDGVSPSPSSPICSRDGRARGHQT